MMKKLMSLTLCLILCMTMVPAFASAEKITRIEKAVEEGGDKALWELVNTRYSTNRYAEEGCAELYIYAPYGPAFPEWLTDDDQMSNRYLIWFQEIAGVGFSLEKLIAYTVYPDGTCEASETPIADPIHVDPCGYLMQQMIWPADGTGRYEIIAAAGTDDNGHELEFYGVIERLNTALPEGENLSGNPDYDVGKIRYEAQFEVPVAHNVWWVPLRALGGSRYTNREIAAMLDHTPEQKQEEISTLYEALQLFKISDFTYTREDYVNITEDDITWAHYKPGRDAVRINIGNCGVDSAWLSYILRGDYEEMGFVAYTKIDDDGHIFNYIYQDGYYYFIDMTGYEGDMATAWETGSKADYMLSGAVSGNLIKAKNPEDYVKYYTELAANAPNMFYLYQADEILPVSGIEDENGLTIFYPEGNDIKAIDGKNPEKVQLKLVPGPKKTYSWAAWKDAKIKPAEQYLRITEKTEPLTAYQPGDRLTLKDESANGRAVVDGTKYITIRRDEVRLGFEENLYLEGAGNRGVYEFMLPLSAHGEAIRNMNSLVLGELNLGIVTAVQETQLVLCVREGDELVVQEVLDGKHYDSRKISVRRDENGTWQETPDYWYLIITRDKKIKYEFGRFHCGIVEED